MADTRPITTPPAPSATDLPLLESKLARRLGREWRRRQLTYMAMGSYAVDALLMLALALLGVVHLLVPFLYFLAGGALTLGLYALVVSGWTRRFNDPFLVPVQIAGHAVVMLPVLLWAPQIGMPLLMVLFVLVGFGGLQITQRSAKRSIAAIAVLACSAGTLVAALGHTLSVPLDTWPERLVSGLWFTLLLLRVSLLGLYGARLRGLLSQRNNDLAATFEKLETLANRDELTGALSRRSIMKVLDDERQRMQRTGHRFGVALLDIDHFKSVNDSFGHLLGDDVLRLFTVITAAHMRSTDRLGRYGGEEFLLVLTATADEDSGGVAIERVRAGVARHHWDQVARGLTITVSAGLAIAQIDESAEQLLSRADTALYEAKGAGRNCVRIG